MPIAENEKAKAERTELVPDTDLIELVCNENERDLKHLVAEDKKGGRN